MALDSSIYGQLKPVEFENPVVAQGRLMQLMAAKDQQAMGALQRQQMERQLAREGRLSQLAESTPEDQLPSALRRAGFYDEAAKIEKARIDNQKAQAEIGKTNAERAKLIAAGFRDMAAQYDETEEGYQQFRQTAQSTYGDQANRLPPTASPGWRTKMIASADKAFDLQKPIMKEINDGQRTVFVDVNPTTNPAVRELAIQMNMSPAEVAADQRALLQLATTRETSALDRESRENIAARPEFSYSPETGTVFEKRSGTLDVARTVSGAPVVPKMSEHQKKELSGIDAQLNTTERALELVKNTPSAFGFVRGSATRAGATAETIAGRFDKPEEREARSTVFNIVSKVINERAGAAQTAQELARLRSFLPAEQDDAEAIRDKMKGFQSFLLEQRKAYEQAPTATPPEVTANRGTRTVRIGGKSLTARQAPDGKFYVEQNGKFFEVQ